LGTKSAAGIGHADYVGEGFTGGHHLLLVVGKS
jgi:hypothetical protein